MRITKPISTPADIDQLSIRVTIQGSDNDKWYGIIDDVRIEHLKTIHVRVAKLCVETMH